MIFQKYDNIKDSTYCAFENIFFKVLNKQVIENYNIAVQ